MLNRILEPEVMESEQDAKEYNRMDHAQVNQQFVSALLDFVRQHQAESAFAFPPSAKQEPESHPAWQPNAASDTKSNSANSEIELDTNNDKDKYETSFWRLGDVLDVGTGTALIPIELCNRTVDCRIMATDLAASMLNLAVYNVSAAGLTEQITLTQADAKNLNFADQMFDLVISNSIVHHIPNPEACIAEMVRVLRTKGIVFVRDLARPDSLDQLNDLVETYTGTESEYSKKLFADSLHASLTVDEMQDLVQRFGFPADSVQKSSDRHWTWCGVKA